MERVAFGFLAMTLGEFESFTPRELQWRYEAELARENRTLDRQAQLACWVLNAFRGKDAQPLRVKDLVQRGPAKNDEWWNEE